LEGGHVTTLTRRSFLAGAATAAGVLAFPALAAAKPKTVAVYRLETGCGDGACACNACKLHDANSLCPSEKAANGNRAHVACNCVITGGRLDYGTYVALFGDPRHIHTYRADLRDPRTAAILKRHPPKFSQLLRARRRPA
jgi:hypothetical protein